MYIPRALTAEIDTFRKIFPVVAILGPRQCGKSTLVKHLFSEKTNAIYLDLQSMEDLNKLRDPVLFFNTHEDKIICLDEIQLLPQLFSVLRSIVDKNRRNGRFVLLGSASRDLIQKSPESLAGRIGYLALTPFLSTEIPQTNIMTFWNRGGFPESLLAENDNFSYIWRDNFIKTYIERDIPQLGFQIPALQLRRFLTLCAHNQAQTTNLSKIAASMEMTHPTMRKYLDLLEQTYLVRSLPPYEMNTKKRLVKSPKIYVRDSGILHQLLGIKNIDMLFAHPVFGASWEGLVVEQLISELNVPAGFYRTEKGDEMDLVLNINNQIIAVECKASSAPGLSAGNYRAIEALKPMHTYIIAPVKGDSYLLHEGITVCGLHQALSELKKIIAE
jgi:predicted AAA+ superfamily ATPase